MYLLSLIFKESNVRDVITMLFVYSTIFVLDERAIAVRLVGTGLKHVGKVEIQYQGQWGTVCHGGNDNWNIKDAHVICRMLGYKAADVAIIAIEGVTSRRFLMYDVGCTGNEKSIAECSHNGWWKVPSVCDNRYNAGVACQTDGGKKDKYLLHYNHTNTNKLKAII